MTKTNEMKLEHSDGASVTEKKMSATTFTVLQRARKRLTVEEERNSADAAATTNSNKKQRQDGAAESEAVGASPPPLVYSAQSTQERRLRVLEMQRKLFALAESQRVRPVYDVEYMHDPDGLGIFSPSWEALTDRYMYRTGAKRLAREAAKRETLCIPLVRNWLECYAREENAAAGHRANLCFQCIEQHSELRQRNGIELGARGYLITPNTTYFTPARSVRTRDTLYFCTCAVNNTVVLCCNVAHAHSEHGWVTQLGTTMLEYGGALYDFVRDQFSIDRYRDRLVTGVYNQNVVAAGTFGIETRERWVRLCQVARLCHVPTHSHLIFQQFEDELDSRESTRPFVQCLRSFCVRTYAEAHRGTPADQCSSYPPETIDYLRRHPLDRRRADVVPYNVREGNYIDANHSLHTRVDAYSATEVTLALILFYVTTGSAGWKACWKLWIELLSLHCTAALAVSRRCQCRARMLDFLACVSFLDFLTPKVFPELMIECIDTLFDKLKS